MFQFCPAMRQFQFLYCCFFFLLSSVYHVLQIIKDFPILFTDRSRRSSHFCQRNCRGVVMIQASVYVFRDIGYVSVDYVLVYNVVEKLKLAGEEKQFFAMYVLGRCWRNSNRCSIYGSSVMYVVVCHSRTLLRKKYIKDMFITP